MAVVRVWTFSNNGMVMAVDENGDQVPEYQGRLGEVRDKIRADWPDAEWMPPFDFAEAARDKREEECARSQDGAPRSLKPELPSGEQAGSSGSASSGSSA